MTKIVYKGPSNILAALRAIGSEPFHPKPDHPQYYDVQFIHVRDQHAWATDGAVAIRCDIRPHTAEQNFVIPLGLLDDLRPEIVTVSSPMNGAVPFDVVLTGAKSGERAASVSDVPNPVDFAAVVARHRDGTGVTTQQYTVQHMEKVFRAAKALGINALEFTSGGLMRPTLVKSKNPSDPVLFYLIGCA